VGVRKRGNDSQTTWKFLPRPRFRRVRHPSRLISDVQGVPSVDNHISVARWVQHSVYSISPLSMEHSIVQFSSNQFQVTFPWSRLKPKPNKAQRRTEPGRYPPKNP
jgi:hypothetical protein